MSNYLHNTDELFESPQYGWEQMQFLLNKKLPAANKKSRKAFYVPYMIAAGFITIFLFSSLVIQNIGYQNFIKKNTAATHLSATAEFRQPAAHSAVAQTSIDPASHTADKKMITLTRGDKRSWTANKSTGLLPALLVEEIPVHRATRAITEQHISHLALKRITLPVQHIADAGTTAADKKSKRRPQPAWGISAGIGINAVIGEKQNLQPFPVAELRYNVSRRLFVSLGLSAGSPVTTHTQGIRKTVFLNDTANNVYFYNSVRQYSKLLYADVPLMAGMRINKKLAVQAGVQASVLLDTKSRTSAEPYDFQMAATSGWPDFTPAPMGTTERHYTVAARKTDFRFVTGVKYTVNKASFNLTYQYAPQSALAGSNVSRNNNQLLSFSMQYNLR